MEFNVLFVVERARTRAHARYTTLVLEILTIYWTTTAEC